MSQQKAQLISPIDTFTPPGINVTGAGIVTATSFVGSGGTVTGLAAGANVTAGVVTATSFYGDGSNLDGVAAAGYVGQTTAAQSGTTTIDLSAGNVIYFTQDTDTTVAFASTESVQELFFIRVKDDTTDARTITWPESIIWNGGSAPTLIDSSSANDVQIFNLTTRDQGVTWYGYEAMQYDAPPPGLNAELFVAGQGSYGQLGQNYTTHRSSPVQIPGTNWREINTTLQAVYGIKSDGTLWVWGRNSEGRLGINDPSDDISSPIQIPGTQWVKTTHPYSACLASKDDGTLWAWGNNDSGQLGINDRVHRSSPVQVPGTNWVLARNSANDGGNAFFAFKTDGTLWTCGNDRYTGQNVSYYTSSPVQVPGTQWDSDNFKSNTAYCMAGMKTDGSLWVWGMGDRLGTNVTYGNYSSPIQIPGTQWKTIAGSQGTAATKTDGTLWTWGVGTYGYLSHNDHVSYSSPKQVSGTQWNEAIAGNYFLQATKTDGTFWVSGYNENGRLGLNDVIPRSSPVQIPGTNWYVGMSAEATTFAFRGTVS